MSHRPSLMFEVATTLRAEVERLRLEPQTIRRLETEARLLPGGPKAKSKSGEGRWLTLGLAGGAVAVAVCLTLAAPWRARGPAALAFTVEQAGAPHAGHIGQLLASDRAGGSATARFSDGSEVTAASGARARVQEVGADGATVALDDGRVEVHVVHRATTAWQVRAGAFRVRVTGTRFVVAWNAAADDFRVRLLEGSVEVSGPGIDAATSRVTAGQELRAGRAGAILAAVGARGGLDSSVGDPAGDRSDDASPAHSEAPGPTNAKATNARTHGAHRSTAARTRGVASAEGPRDWRALAAEARYRDALALAVAGDFEGDCHRLPAGDLMLLGDVARLGGDASRAERAYRSALARFATLDRPSFALGLVAFEGRHDYRGAATWFARYLREHPTGALGTEASGRLIESLHRAGDDAEARAAASRYLREHPAGAHAALARALTRS